VIDVLLRGGLVHLSDSPIPMALSVGITGNRISYIGPPHDEPSARKVIQLDGQLITPGIIDSHNHLLLGFDSDAVNLQDLHTVEHVRDRLSTFAQSRSDLSWVCGENANYTVVAGRRPNAHDLAGVTDRPVFITTYDQHSVWLNDVAIQVLGITKTSEFAWGNPEFDDRTGEPTGWITDFYTSAMTSRGIEALRRDIPMYSPNRRYRKLLSSLSRATELGITTAVEPQVPLAEIDLLERARDEGKLSSRVIAALFHPVNEGREFRATLRSTVDNFAAHDRLELGPIKLYADDVIEPHTAWMLDDYANRPGLRGHPSTDVEDFFALFNDLDKLGFQTHTHATGDAGVRLILDAIEHAAHTNSTKDRRHGIVHVECIHSDDLPRLNQLGVTAAMQPRHCSPDLIDGTWMDNVGQERWDRAWRIQSLMKSGANVAFSSDWQVGEMDPLVGMYSAMTRASLDGTRSWTPNERTSCHQAINAYTINGAHAWHHESDRGELRVGALADVVVWSTNLYELTPDELLDQKALTTIVDGVIEHDAR